jgi:isopenicillin-N N-acyltransferase-like protein
VRWQVVPIAGGPRARGRAYGAAARDRAHATVALYEAVFASYTGLTWSDVRERAGRFVDAIEAYDVQVLPEIEGIAEGASLDAEDVLAVNVRTEIMFGLDARAGRAAKECTALGVAGDAPFVAQTWDWKPGARDTVIVLVCAPADRPGFVSMVEAGLLAKCGMNEAGIGLGFNALQSSADRGEPGVPAHAIARRVLTSGTFEEAVDAVTRGPRAASANYLIGHADGRVVDLEARPGGPDEIHGPDVLAHTNHFLQPSPRPYKDLGRIGGEDSIHRQAVAEGALATGADIASTMTVLGSHEGGHDLAVCRHEDPSADPVEDYATVGAMVADLATRTLHLADGNPCEHPFEALDVAGLVAEARSAATIGSP